MYNLALGPYDPILQPDTNLQYLGTSFRFWAWQALIIQKIWQYEKAIN
jgi:hypothetical protein